MDKPLDEVEVAAVMACHDMLWSLLTFHRERLGAAASEGPRSTRIERLAQRLLVRALDHYYAQHTPTEERTRVDILGQSLSLTMSMMAGEHNIVRDNGDVIDHSRTLPGGESGTSCACCGTLLTRGRFADLREAAGHLAACPKKLEKERAGRASASSKRN